VGEDGTRHAARQEPDFPACNDPNHIGTYLRQC
jgi:hypothetical protein